jgi:hypothetical protein
VGHEVPQVFTEHLKLEMSESGEDRMCRQLPDVDFIGEEREWRFEFKGKLFESGQCGEARTIA